MDGQDISKTAVLCYFVSFSKVGSSPLALAYADLLRCSISAVFSLSFSRLAAALRTLEGEKVAYAFSMPVLDFS